MEVKLAPKKIKKTKPSEKGRPTLYKPEYCKTIIEFFDKEPFREKEKKLIEKGNFNSAEYMESPNLLPTFERFAHHIGVVVDTLQEWKKVHKNFSAAYARAKQLQLDLIIQNTLRNNFNSGFASLLVRNCHGWKEKSEVDQISSTVTQIKFKVI